MREQWKLVWRMGFAPLLPTRGLVALREALLAEDTRLIQGATIEPPPLWAVQDWPVEAACGIGFCGWQSGEGLDTVAEVEEFFARACFEADQLIGEPAACRFFLNFWDETPWKELVQLFLPELEKELDKRKKYDTISS